MKDKGYIPLVVLLAFAMVVLARPAHAYLDPGTGGVLLQLLLGGIAGIGLVLKLYWSRLKSTFNNLMGKEAPKPKRTETAPD